MKKEKTLQREATENELLKIANYELTEKYERLLNKFDAFVQQVADARVMRERYHNLYPDVAPITLDCEELLDLKVKLIKSEVWPILPQIKQAA